MKGSSRLHGGVGINPQRHFLLESLFEEMESEYEAVS